MALRLPANWPLWVGLALLMSPRAKGLSWPVGPSKLSLDALRRLAGATGFPDPNLAAAVAMAESAGDPNAKNISAIEASYGLWQINVRAHPKYNVQRLSDPAYNARAAFEVSTWGTDWTPWTAYTTTDPNLSYKRYL